MEEAHPIFPPSRPHLASTELKMFMRAKLDEINKELGTNFNYMYLKDEPRPSWYISVKIPWKGKDIGLFKVFVGPCKETYPNKF